AEGGERGPPRPLGRARSPGTRATNRRTGRRRRQRRARARVGSPARPALRARRRTGRLPTTERCRPRTGAARGRALPALSRPARGSLPRRARPREAARRAGATASSCPSRPALRSSRTSTASIRAPGWGGASRRGANQTSPVEHSVPIEPDARQWRTLTLIATVVATIEFLILFSVFVAKPLVGHLKRAAVASATDSTKIPKPPPVGKP